MAKKWNRIKFGLRCVECGTQNYVSERNKLNTQKLEMRKYCRIDRKHTLHKTKEKMK